MTSTLPLQIDTAYFAFFPLKRNYRDDFLKEFAEECEGIKSYLSRYDGVNIYLNHHFTPDMLNTSALFIDQVPKLIVTHKIREHYKKFSTEPVLCQQVISLGETTVLGDGRISLFEGTHLFNFHGRAINRNDLSSLSMERFPLRIITGAKEIDAFFDKLIVGLVEKNMAYVLHETWFLNRLSEVVLIIQKWLSDEPRALLHGSRINQEYSMSLTKELSKAFNDLHDELLLHNTEIANDCKILLLNKFFTIKTPQKKYSDRIDISAEGSIESVSAQLHRFNENNQKHIDGLNIINGILVALAAPLFGVVYKAVADLDYVSTSSLYYVAVAVSLNFLAAIHALLSYFPPYVNLLRLILPASKNPNNQDALNSGNYREQLKYRGKYEDFAFQINKRATAKAKVILSRLDFDEACEVIKKADQIYYRRIQVGITIVLYIISLIFYAIASLEYGTRFLGISWLDTLLNFFR